MIELGRTFRENETLEKVNVFYENRVPITAIAAVWAGSVIIFVEIVHDPQLILYLPVLPPVFFETVDKATGDLRKQLWSQIFPIFRKRFY